MNKKTIKLIIFSAIGVIAAVVIAVVVVTNLPKPTRTLECKNTTGTLTINYNDDEITNYNISGTGVTFNMTEANSLIKGTEKNPGAGANAYISTFMDDFVNNQGGSCDIL